MARSIDVQESGPTLLPNDQKPAMARIWLRKELLIRNNCMGSTTSVRSDRAKDGTDYDVQDNFSGTFLANTPSKDGQKFQGRRNEAASSAGFVLVESIMDVTCAMLGIRQIQNVEHGLPPLPLLRESRRCRVLGIQTGGDGHPSSNETLLQSQG